MVTVFLLVSGKKHGKLEILHVFLIIYKNNKMLNSSIGHFK
jgi:hypothetical protein